MRALADRASTWRHRIAWTLLALGPLALAACTLPPDDSPEDGVRQRLTGTWLREYDEPGARIRRVLVLAPDGSFTERSCVMPADGGAPVLSTAEGRWAWDGTNLKRHYNRINGRSTYWTGNPFVTFELSFPSRLSFEGVNHVRKRTVRYDRVADDTLAADRMGLVISSSCTVCGPGVAMSASGRPRCQTSTCATAVC